MLFNYLTVAFRNVMKQRGYTVINILGLSIGLTAAIFIFLYVNDELTFDKLHPEAEKTYRLGYHLEFPNGDVQTFPASPGGWDNYIMDNYEGVQNVTSFSFYGMPTNLRNPESDKIILTEEILWVEPNYREIIYMPITKGNPDLALADPGSIVLSESAAYELFGDEDPINKSLSLTHMWATGGEKVDLLVTGVMEDMPTNSHLRPKYLVNIFTLNQFDEALAAGALDTYMGELNAPGYWAQSLFVTSQPEVIPTIMNDLQNRANKIIEEGGFDVKFRPLVRKLTDVHFDQEIDWAVSHKASDKQFNYVFITIALLILLIAGINYMNLATARSAKRAKEVGMRKTLGSTRWQLFAQFISESLILVLISTIISIILVAILIPQFNSISGKYFDLSYLMNPAMLLILLGVILFVTLVAGSYPAFYLSGFQPAAVLKGKVTVGKRSNILRRILIIVQFSISVLLLISAVVIVRQMNLMRYSKLNESGDQIVSIRYGGFSGIADNNKYQTFKDRVLQDPQIAAVTLANHLPRLDYFGGLGMPFMFPDISEDELDWNRLNGDFDFPSAFDMQLVAGRTFDTENISDSSSVLINQSAVKSLGISPEEVLGQAIITPVWNQQAQSMDFENGFNGTVIGVVEDFPYQSMYHEIEPLVISPHPDDVDRIIHVSIPVKNMGQKIAELESTWKEVFPDFGFDYWFIDEEFARMYEYETRIAAMTERFSLLAILITCVGLYGMASFMATQKTKEIGIRKALGASSSQILILLLNTFIKMLAIASVIAVPLAFIFSDRWLESFVYRTPLSAWIFVLAILVIAAITIFTVGHETLKAARSNPVKALKYE